MNETTGTRDYDWWLLAIVAAICALGVVEIYSATHGSVLVGMHSKQIRWLVIGFALMFVLSRIDYHLIMDQALYSILLVYRHLLRFYWSGTPALAPNAGFLSSANFFRCQNWSN